jgi:endonuclease/exonuclease/phosphatase family metal-dependent hydrolase
MLRSLTVLLSCLTFAGYAAPYFDPFAFWPLAFLGLAYPVFALANFVALLIWLTRRRRIWALLPFLTLLAGMDHFNGLIGLRAFGAQAPGEKSFRVVTYNVRRFQPHGQPFGFVIDKREWERELQALDPDILVLQEYEPVSAINAEATCAAQGLKYRAINNEEDLVIFSRYPILGTKAFIFHKIYGFRYADIDVEGRIFRVFSVHLQSNAITRMAETMAENASFKEKKTWIAIKGMLGRYRKAAKTRKVQAQEIAEQVRQSPYPVILCGDLNDVSQSRVYHILRAGLQDAFLECGSGLGITYAGSLPALRIDMIFADATLKILRCKTGKTGFSDHQPVIADFAR